jgi:phosphoribosylanthranilate isomerase
MTRTRIKICGLREPDHAKLAGDLGVDAIGLVFAKGSPREVDARTAEQVIAAAPAFVEVVGLFVNAKAEVIKQLVAALGLHTVQLHGTDSPDDVASLAPVRVIKSVPVRSGSLDEALTPWRNPPANLAGLLYDAPPPADATLPGQAGGSGHAFDWSHLKAARDRNELIGLPPLILAGGLTADNVADAIAIVEPFAVDVSSGVESERGIKDTARMRAFCDAVRRADALRVPDR